MPTARDAVEEHLAAFNAHDTSRLLAGFSADVAWSTGRDVVRGQAELAGLFDDGLWQLAPTLSTVSIVADGPVVATELREQLTVDGDVREFDIAAFFEVSNGLIRRAKVYREGTADID